MHVYDDEDAIIEAQRSNQNANSGASEKIKDNKDNQTNVVPKDWRILHDHLKDYILGKTTTHIHTHSSFHNKCANLPFYLKLNLRSLKKVTG